VNFRGILLIDMTFQIHMGFALITDPAFLGKPGVGPCALSVSCTRNRFYVSNGIFTAPSARGR
jgi:hypothetical protein